MRIMQVEYKELRSHKTGYGNTSIGCTIAVNEAESAMEAYETAQQFVRNRLDAIVPLETQIAETYQKLYDVQGVLRQTTEQLHRATTALNEARGQLRLKESDVPVDGTCPNCGVELRGLGDHFDGYRNVAYKNCPSCDRELVIKTDGEPDWKFTVELADIGEPVWPPFPTRPASRGQVAGE